MTTDNLRQGGIFEARLTQYMIQNHPDKIEDVSFISERSRMAAHTFETSSVAGLSVDESMHEAETTLFHGLLFSPYHLVREVLTGDFDYSDESPELDEFALQMLDMVAPVLQRYDIGDDFAGSPQEMVLYDEIKESINQYLVKNGLQ